MNVIQTLQSHVHSHKHMESKRIDTIWINHRRQLHLKNKAHYELVQILKNTKKPYVNKQVQFVSTFQKNKVNLILKGTINMNGLLGSIVRIGYRIKASRIKHLVQESSVSLVWLDRKASWC